MIPALRYPFDMAWPVTAAFGENGPWWTAYGKHTGLDLGAPDGATIRAVDSGTVQSAGPNGTFGLTVVVRHAWGESLYAHASALLVHAGQPVTAGQALALVGMTGTATGPHLHLGIYPDGEPQDNGAGGAVDPAPFLHSAGAPPSGPPLDGGSGGTDTVPPDAGTDGSDSGGGAPWYPPADSSAPPDFDFVRWAKEHPWLVAAGALGLAIVLDL